MLTTITTIIAVLFALTSLAGLVLAGWGWWRFDPDLDNAILLTAGAMFGWAAIAMLWGVGV